MQSRLRAEAAGQLVIGKVGVYYSREFGTQGGGEARFRKPFLPKPRISRQLLTDA
jgi:hypothetical protein